MRGSKMEDVIFNGTSLKEPVNFAEVSLTLSNEAKLFPIEYEEITVTRRLFRSGESEYLLNKTPVRLKDILDLFMGTGIGTSAYSILEQGKMDLILSSRAEDRRFVFEEAAGITKFKSQKREALRKLEDTENNLVRVADIINEVSRQLSSMERQARRAERYQAIFNVLKDKELRVSKHLYLKLANQAAALEGEKNAVKAQEERALIGFNALDAEIKKKRDALETTEQEIAIEQNSRVHLDAAADKNQSKINLNKERIKELGERIDVLGKEISELTQKIGLDSGELTELRVQFEDFRKSEETKKSVLKAKQDLLGLIENQLKEKEGLISSSRVQLMELAQEISRKRNALSKVRTEHSVSLARLRRLEVDKEKTASEKTRFYDALNQTKQILDERRSGLGNLSEQIEKVKNNIAGLDEKLRDLTDRSHHLEIESKTLGSRIEFLEGMKARYEGYSAGVRSLMLAKKNGELHIEGVFDVLADVLEVDKGYENALESALGRYVQAVLVKGQVSLGICLEYARKHNLGEIIFVVMEEIKNNGSDNSLRVLSGGDFVYLKDFVHTAPAYECVVKYLLDGFVVIRDLDEAVSLCRERKIIPLRLVTPEGGLVEYGIVKTAPVASGEDTHIIGRERRIKELKENFSSVEADRADSINNRHSISLELAKLNQELILLQETKHVSEVELVSLEQEAENLNKNLKKLTDELAILDLEITESRGETETTARMTKEHEEALSELEAKESGLNRFINESNNFLAEKGSLRENALVEIAGLETELRSFMERVLLFNERVSSAENSIEEQKRMLTTRENDKLQSAERSRVLLEEISGLEKDNISLISERECVLQKLSALNEKKSQAKASISGEEEKTGHIQKELETIRNRIYELEMKQQEINFNRRDISEKINSSYRVNLETAEVDLTIAGFNEEMDRQEIDVLKEKLEAMGPVNLVAIEEHRQLQERQTFLLNQQADLNKAKESLLEAINRINRTTRELFSETFQKIEVNFKEIFRLLFGGGNAQLILLEPEDVLESGIEIIAQPPGKKLQNISLLSGGEKALTAVALLFAIFKVRPSPFCILDEVDAPLDEANIDRFRMLMKEFARTSQFIVITHNKKTITIADVMYGITMEESGISKIVSVRFSDATENAKI